MCAEPTIAGSDPDKQHFFSGLPGVWIVDAIIEFFPSMLGYDVVVLHTQPNKSGTYQVEMCDVTKIKSSFGTTAPPGQSQWWPGGTCGDEPSKGFECQNRPYKGSRGSPPRVASSSSPVDDAGRPVLQRVVDIRKIPEEQLRDSQLAERRAAAGRLKTPAAADTFFSEDGSAFGPGTSLPAASIRSSNG